MNPAFAARSGFAGRLGAITRRERLFLLAGGISLAAFAAWMMSGPAEEAPPAPVAPPAPIVAAPPVAAPVVATAASTPAVPANLILSGVMGTGAIFTVAEGQQRAVPIGREVAPGLTLKSVGIGHVILAGAGDDLRLDLSRFGGPVAAGPTAVAAPAPAAGGADSPVSRAERQRETIAFRLGLAPAPGSGGYAIRPNARIPHLARAGLRPGDVILSVNGSQMNEERVDELSWEIANASRTEFEILRGGQKLKTVLKRQ